MLMRRITMLTPCRLRSLGSLAIVALLCPVLGLLLIGSLHSWHSPLFSLLRPGEANSVWLASHSKLLSQLDGAAHYTRTLFLNSPSAAIPAEALQQPHTCVGILLHGRSEPYAARLLSSLLHQRASAAAAGVQLAVPWTLSLYWEPSNPRPAAVAASFVTTLLSRHVDVVRVDQGIHSQRRAAAAVGSGAKCPLQPGGGELDPHADQLRQWAKEEGATEQAAAALDAAGATGPASVMSRRSVLGAHFAGFALEDMLRRHGNCSQGLLLLEDDTLAAAGWEEALQATLARVAEQQPDWRVLKLFTSEDTSTEAFLAALAKCWLAALLLTACAAAAAVSVRRFPSPTFCSSLKPLLCPLTLPLLLLSLACLLALGPSRLPCPLYYPACSSLQPLQGAWANIFTQAHAYNPSNAASMAGCLASTPLARGPGAGYACFASDVAQQRCLALGQQEYQQQAELLAPFGESKGAAAVQPAQPLPALPCPSTNADCVQPSFLQAPGTPPVPLHGLWLALPPLFQHAGTVNSAGQLRPLLVSDAWAGYGSWGVGGPASTWRHLWAWLWPVAV